MINRNVPTKSIYIEGKPWMRETTKKLETVLANGEDLVVPKGYKTDLATVPRFLWAFFPPHGRDEHAFIIHDYLYDKRLYTRKFADDEMLRYQLEAGSSKHRAYLMWFAVRLFAGSYWKN